MFGAHGAVVPVAPAVAVSTNYDPLPQYTYAYNVQDALTGDSKSQQETRDGDIVRGMQLLEWLARRSMASDWLDRVCSSRSYAWWLKWWFFFLNYNHQSPVLSNSCRLLLAGRTRRHAAYGLLHCRSRQWVQCRRTAWSARTEGSRAGSGRSGHPCTGSRGPSVRLSVPVR